VEKTGLASYDNPPVSPTDEKPGIAGLQPAGFEDEKERLEVENALKRSSPSLAKD